MGKMGMFLGPKERRQEAECGDPYGTSMCWILILFLTLDLRQHSSERRFNRNTGGFPQGKGINIQVQESLWTPSPLTRYSLLKCANLVSIGLFVFFLPSLLP